MTHTLTHPLGKNVKISQIRIPVENFRPPEAHNDIKYMQLQSQMMDNGWQLHQDEDDDGNVEEYFVHPTYGDMKAPVMKYICHPYHHSKVLKFPILELEDDTKGLGCNVEVTCAGTHKEIISNEWNSFWSTRRGRRRSKQLAHKARKRAAEDREVGEIALMGRSGITGKLL